MGKIGIQCIFPPILRVQVAFYAIFQFFYICFRQQVRNLVKMKKNIFCLLYFGRKIHFLKLSRRCRPPRVGIRFYDRCWLVRRALHTLTRKSESNKRFLTDSVIIILFIFSTFITYYFTFGQEPPASITALPFSGAEAPL